MNRTTAPDNLKADNVKTGKKETARILVVDDESSIRKLTARSLAAEGLDARTAKDGETALAIMASESFDIVISDIAMPGMSGIELAKNIIRTHAADVIMMTGRIREFKYDEMITMGARDFIQKPFSPDEIVLRINRILRERRIKEELDLFRKEFAQAQKLEAVGQLSAGIAHEINTPVQYIGDNVAFIRDGYQDLDRLVTSFSQLFEAVKAGNVTPGLVSGTEAAIESTDMAFLREELPGAIDQTLEGVKRISEIVRAIKVFSHPGDQAHAPVNLNKNIETAVLISRSEWKHIADMSLDLDPNLPRVRCDAGQINQVLLNLIINASHSVSDRFPPDQENRGRIRVASLGPDGLESGGPEPGSQESRGRVRISVRDNGNGVPKDAEDRIFDPFFTTKSAGRGTGQGLAIAKNIVENRHGGKLYYSAEEEGGARFTLELPLA